MNMSLGSKIALGASCFTSVIIVGYVHYKQKLDQERLHDGVIMDIERRQRRKQENLYILEKQADITKQLRKEMKEQETLKLFFLREVIRSRIRAMSLSREAARDRAAWRTAIGLTGPTHASMYGAFQSELRVQFQKAHFATFVLEATYMLACVGLVDLVAAFHALFLAASLFRPISLMSFHITSSQVFFILPLAITFFSYFCH